MELIRVVTKNFVYSRGLRLPVPPGFTEEPVVVDRMAILDTEEGSVVRMVCVPEEGAAPEDWIQDGLVFVVDVMVGEDVRLEYLTTSEMITAMEEHAQMEAESGLPEYPTEEDYRRFQEEDGGNPAVKPTLPSPGPFGPGPSGMPEVLDVNGAGIVEGFPPAKPKNRAKSPLKEITNDDPASFVSMETGGENG